MINPKVRILKRSQIDDTKWNLTIQQAVNSLPYAYTWYIDALCTKWIALIVGEYDFVMPIAIGRKWGFLYAYQPLFCQQLGVFYRSRNEVIIDLMLKTAFKQFLYINLNINFDNTTKTRLRGLSKKENLVLKLSGKHTETQKKYSDNTLRNIKKGQKAGLTFEAGDKRSYENFTDFYITNTAIKDSHFKPKHADTLKCLIHQFVIQDCGRLFLAKTTDGEICAGVMVVETPDRIIHLLPAADEHARQNGAMQFLVDAMLHHYAGSDKVYDFEGSSVKSIARFYEGFGAETEGFFMLEKSPFKVNKTS
jgi:hypothetical protein